MSQHAHTHTHKHTHTRAYLTADCGIKLGGDLEQRLLALHPPNLRTYRLTVTKKKDDDYDNDDDNDDDYDNDDDDYDNNKKFLEDFGKKSKRQLSYNLKHWLLKRE